MSKAFELFNQTLVIDDDFHLDIQLRRLIMDHAEDARKEFEEFYQKKLHSMRDLMENGEDIALEILKKHAIQCVDVIVSWEIYTLSATEILRKTTDSYFGREFNDLENWYISVLQHESDKDAYRTARRKNRSKWVGGGFGLNSAVYAATQAGALNLASGALHGTVNLIGKGFSTVGASITKESMFNNIETRKRLATALYMDVFGWIYIIESAIRENGHSIRTINNRDAKKAQSLFENLKRMNSKADLPQAFGVAYQIFATNPSEYKYYEYCIKTFPTQQQPLFSLANYCNINIRRLSEIVMEAIFDTMPRQTEAEVLELKSRLQVKQEEFGISSSATMQKVDNILHDLDIKARTFRNVLYDTREQRASAEADYKTLVLLCENLAVASIGECGRLRASIQSSSYDKKMKSEFLSQIDARINTQKLANAQKNYDTAFMDETTIKPQLSFVRWWKRIPTFITIVFLLRLYWNLRI